MHVLGAETDQAIREQIDLALEAEKKVIFCLARGHESASGEQKELIGQIRENRLGLRQGTWALLESRSPAVLKQDLIDLQFCWHLIILPAGRSYCVCSL